MHPKSFRALSRALFAATAIAALATATAVSAAPAWTNVPVLQEHVAVKYRGAEASTELAKVFHDSDEAQLKLGPIGALMRGDPRYHDQFGDYLSDDYIAATEAAYETDWRRLHEIDRASLSPEEQIAYDVFEWQTKLSLEGNTPSIVAATIVRPIDHFTGVHMQFAAISTGDSIAPFKTVKDYDDGLSRIDGFVVFMDKAIVRMREGMKTGVAQPKLVVNNVIAQLDAMIAMGVDKSPFYQPIAKMPAGFSASDKARLTAAYRDRIAKIVAVYTRMRDFLKNEYLPAARDSVGLSAMPGGAELYAYMVESQTTTRHDARGNPRARPLRGGAHQGRDGKGPPAGRVRRRPACVLRISAHRSASSSRPRRRICTNAMSRSCSACRRRSRATFRWCRRRRWKSARCPTTSKRTRRAVTTTPARPTVRGPASSITTPTTCPRAHTWDNESLFLHEGVPGHHFQISADAGKRQLPAFMRFGGNTAYVEGWALYAESLGPELGMYTDPYQMFGHLNDEMLRAMRLVVDTGIHAKGWTRDQAIQYMLDNSAMGRTDATSEVERYIAMPGQALAYKIGQLTIRRLQNQGRSRRWDPSSTSARSMRRCWTPARCRCRCWKPRSTAGSPHRRTRKRVRNRACLR